MELTPIQITKLVDAYNKRKAYHKAYNERNKDKVAVYHKMYNQRRSEQFRMLKEQGLV